MTLTIRSSGADYELLSDSGVVLARIDGLLIQYLTSRPSPADGRNWWLELVAREDDPKARREVTL